VMERQKGIRETKEQGNKNPFTALGIKINLSGMPSMPPIPH
jgi:hypothetical protein